ncbi:MAG: DUF4200 domain-containing protein [Nitrospira defluvii]|nr:DUF4200 domain-containing protein [Nitrospira defluvii]
MQSITLRRTLIAASRGNIRRVALCWMVGSAVLLLGGCVSQQTYDSARHGAKARANELAQAQAEIQSLEQQRDTTHAANQRDERTLGNLKSELQKIQTSFDQIRKTNQAKLAALQHNIAALRARHQAMLKEISETKRYEKKLEALTAQHEREMATTPSGPEAHVTTVDGLPQEPHMVAVITPQSPQADRSSSSSSPAPAPSQLDAPAAPSINPSAVTPQATAAAVAAPAPPSIPAKTAQAPVTTPSPNTNAPSAPQNDSWFSSMTGWLTSIFDWLWT